MKLGLRLLTFAAVCLAVPTALGCRRPAPTNRVTVFAAASLDQVLADLSEHLRRTHGPEAEAQIGGSQEAARKVSEYGLPADVVVVADYRIIDWLLKPTYARWTIRFATNELVIAYSERSKYATDINTDNWPDILLRPGVKVARADENLAPVGYQTLLCWQLAQTQYAKLLNGRDLASELSGRTSEDLVRPDVTSLVPLLGTRADYAFLYRSVAHGHNLPYVRLSGEVNLADPSQAALYARVHVELAKPKTTVRGAPIIYGLTIPTNAPHPQAAIRFVAALLGAEGRRILERNDFTALAKPECDAPAELPPSLAAIVGAPQPRAAQATSPAKRGAPRP